MEVQHESKFIIDQQESLSPKSPEAQGAMATKNPKRGYSGWKLIFCFTETKEEEEESGNVKQINHEFSLYLARYKSYENSDFHDNWGIVAVIGLIGSILTIVQFFA